MPLDSCIEQATKPNPKNVNMSLQSQQRVRSSCNSKPENQQRFCSICWETICCNTLAWVSLHTLSNLLFSSIKPYPVSISFSCYFNYNVSVIFMGCLWKLEDCLLIILPSKWKGTVIYKPHIKLWTDILIHNQVWWQIFSVVIAVMKNIHK